MKVIITEVQLKRFNKLIEGIPFISVKWLWVNGITLAPFCILLKKKHADNPFLKNHEAIHWYQAKKRWYVGFYIQYIFEWISKWGYKNISFEKEAYANETNLDYLQDK